MRPEGGSRVLVEDALEERAEDSGLDVGPVQCVELLELENLVRRQVLGHVVVSEEVAVDPGDGLGAVASTALHDAEEVGEGFAELARVRRLGAEQVRERPPRKQPDVAREHAEDGARDEARDAHVVGVAPAA